MRQFYMCTTDCDFELGETACATYASLEETIRKRPCVMTCGVTKITLNDDGTYTEESASPENRSWNRDNT